MFTPQQFLLKHPVKHRAHLCKRVTKPLPYSSFYSGTFGLKLLEFGFLTPKHLSSVYSTINKIIKKCGTVRFFVFPTSYLTTKSKNARMGKGKGKTIRCWICKVKAGSILCEITTSNKSLAVKALLQARFKLPISSVIVYN